MSISSVLPAGSTVVVTGANGFVASHLVQQLLLAGYKVRGTARAASKLQNLRAKWNAEFGEGKFEALVVEDLTKIDALKEAMQGASAVAHVASDLSMSSDPNAVIPAVIAMTENILSTANATPSIKRVVLTSSTGAGAISQPGVEGIEVNEWTWNEFAKKEARATPEEDPLKGLWVYCASKTEGEQAAWAYVEKEKPHFEFNSVVPTFVMGPTILPDQVSSSAGIVKALFFGDKGYASMLPPQYFVNAEDVALVHLGALTLPSVVSQRVWSVAEPYNWDQVLAIFRKLHPSRTFVEDFQDGHDLSQIDRSKATEVLRQLGREGWRGLSETLEAAVGRE
ncbi:Nadph-dependent carbonyl reductase from Sporobolomyces Salmonicolor [Leucosporidium creatinivorum]|uniref:Nadph-dependent carbonyl reductase from Sporobolomyces Salmonicolor n=1 Tax=Leucosporidium creatinivorum TaxID=106004 RepID=A0A1Y2G1B9_9BASI|nr:Nadph-dependent carbonyl reductase from Sporobolomyces Salmonicolor [Leucosporidium creatinivorum]